MLALAESKEEVLEKLKQDTYWKSGVWDESKVSIVYVHFERSGGVVGEMDEARMKMERCGYCMNGRADVIVDSDFPFQVGC